MSTSSTVDRAFRAALYATTDDALDTGASLLASDPAADAELAGRGEEFVATAWRRGWQPADVVRIVRRELDDVHVRLVSALIRAQAPHDRPRGPRWHAQLGDLGGLGDRDGREAASARRTDRFSHATAVLELYRLLLRLPALEPLDEPDGGAAGSEGAGGAGSPGRERHPESRMLGRIRGLLAKAEATGFPEEAEALTAKAQELMARHSVDEALLAVRAPSAAAPGACRIGVEPPYEQTKAVLLDAIATANHCRAVWNEALGFSTVVGFASDLEAVELLHTSLLVQAGTAMAKAEAAQRAGGRKRTKTFRQSFLAAYVHRVGARLAAAAESQLTDDSLPVLASRDVAVTERLDRLLPETTTTRLRGVSDAAGWEEGARAADDAQVEARGRLPGRRP
ncbi:DUF2786 domain-containing protein [Streptomyces sp. M2CJ-2]|uniref:DUF2786 domain-containing protein n=1 Tax=Streptomyces sp. M2CJ-2 TaxID=2803948 RepID=UPI001925BD5E|nr:DUF2786 domain-containing protein [Streptomyces sp. M2CJ-2]MBL3670979.1 DUF2786 domain-containing protein [Streptomyces sp. M2CJ-2]